MPERPRFRAEPVTAPPQPAQGGDAVELPRELGTRRLARRTLEVVAILVVAGLIIEFAPGLGALRDHLDEAQPGWIALAVLFEGLSCVSYLLMFKPIFCRHMPWRTATEIAFSELAMGSIIPASGIGGLALGAWILREGGMPPDKIARRSVAFFIIKSGANFVAVVVVGTIMALHLGGWHVSPWLTIGPAVAAAATIAAVVWVPRLGLGPGPRPDAGAFRRAVSASRRALVNGTAEAIEITRQGNVLVVVGTIGYWAWDNAVLWATFKAFGYSPPITIVLMGYLIGQLGGLLPLPGGLGGIDGGLLGTLVVYGTPVAVTAAAVVAYRVILFWLPLITGGIAFASLRRGLNRPDRPDLCVVPAAT